MTWWHPASPTSNTKPSPPPIGSAGEKIERSRWQSTIGSSERDSAVSLQVPLRFPSIAAAVAGLLLIWRGISGASRVRPPTVPNPRRVAALGDSITADGRYLAQLATYLPPGSSTKVFGYSGQGVQAITSHLSEVLAWAPTDLIVLGGVNDLAAGRRIADTIAHLANLYETARAHGIRVIAVIPTPWAGHTYGADRQTETQVLAAGIRGLRPDVVIESRDMGDDRGRILPQYDGGDGLHPNGAGQRAIGNLISIAFK